VDEREIEEIQKAGEDALKEVSGTDKCPTCKKTVYFAEKVLLNSPDCRTW
jgi:hypothetical protein